MLLLCSMIFFFFFNDTATTEIYTLSLHDALPISLLPSDEGADVVWLLHVGDRVHPGDALSRDAGAVRPLRLAIAHRLGDRKSTRLNSSHDQISYAVFCLKKKKTNTSLPPLTQVDD